MKHLKLFMIFSLSILMSSCSVYSLIDSESTSRRKLSPSCGFEKIVYTFNSEDGVILFDNEIMQIKNILNKKFTNNSGKMGDVLKVSVFKSSTDKWYSLDPLLSAVTLGLYNIKNITKYNFELEFSGRSIKEDSSVYKEQSIFNFFKFFNTPTLREYRSKAIMNFVKSSQEKMKC